MWLEWKNPFVHRRPPDRLHREAADVLRRDGATYGQRPRNLSPKGIDETFRVLDEHTVAYLDITASRAETIAHRRENGRITVMFFAFEGPPNIIRLHGTGRVIIIHDDEYAAWAPCFGDVAGARAVIVIDVERISDSCGYGVPTMTHAGERDLLPQHMARKGAEGRADYRRTKNRLSIDGLPAFDYDD